MAALKEKAQGGRTPRAFSSKSTDESKLKQKPTKKRRVLEALAQGLRFHRFDAERNGLHDHCLPSTISALESDHQIVIARETVEVPGYDGSTAHPAEYWLEHNQLIKARKILGWAL